tara:strand:- start:1567 stop:2187 length:621 start_codon:yes stop_codon:yes gene_type:complete
MLKNTKQLCNPATAFIAGVVFGVLGGLLIINYAFEEDSQYLTADPYDTEYHVHADFHIVINDTLVNLDDDMFQTTSEQTLHPDAHLHDNNSDVKHIHAEEITFAEFLGSLSIQLTNDCITLDNKYCADEANQLTMYVNDEVYVSDISSYIPDDNDRILVHFGANDTDLEVIQSLLDAVPDDSCYYSGTCPERGIAPDESCGLTCEL